jgi:PhnB protein
MTISPYLYYEDVESALAWLTRVFGFHERLRVPGADARITHAEMDFADSVIMMGHPGPDYKSPKRLGHVFQLQYVRVADVDSHFARARDAGAKILAEPKDQPYGDRTYAVEDLEGHHWYFAQHLAKA